MFNVILFQRKHKWTISIHSFKRWRVEFRKENEFKVPFFARSVKLPYGEFEREGEKYLPYGTYFFPFAVRYFKKVEEKHIQKERLT